MDVRGKGGLKEDAGVDVLVVPTAPTLPPTVESLKRASSVETYMNDVFTVPASLAGLPALSVPVQARGLQRDSDGGGDGDGAFGSVGIQIIGQFGDDEMVLRVGEMLEGMGME
ncbi:aspartyl-tRNA(Asn)/glutamyl-tRNA (Gln) amidotransferase subunit A [Blastomyces silverae]|uniref:Aspartyl-tRNA(Asn)/glutamyl-tRNA (Gln) amidotransferase subunit A n=1 Tax=Blastomyces silverae TaxID=2060906 RepID=A0A0H1BAY6_9EURO|nr:aspartyl-tRNA(Asn)/glutamyl-tRNA (Gln) amidotransferase subunit A [Blastomyces silverae]